MKKTWLLALLCMIIVFSVPMIRTVAADDDDETEEAEERELEIEIEDDAVTVESEFENETVENEFKIMFSVEEGICLDLSFSSEVNATEFELEVKVLFLKLVEFADKNGDGVPNIGEEIQTIDLTTSEYSSPTATQTTSKDGKTGYKFDSHTENEDFVFQIIAEIFPVNAVVNGATLKPTELKITIVIKDFPYDQNGSLALMVKATSEMEMEEETANTEKEVEVKSATAQGYFSWLNEASVDEVSREVKSSVVNADKGKLIALSYPNGKEIVHDPKLGVSLLAAIIGLPWLYIAVGAALVAMAVAISIRVFRPKMYDQIGDTL